MTTITTQQENTIINSVAASLVRDELCTPKQALAVAVIFSSNLSNLLTDSEEWFFQVHNAMMDAEVDGVSIFATEDEQLEEDWIKWLLESGYVEDLNYILTDSLICEPVYIAGKRTIKVLDEVKASYAPMLASDGVQERRRGYSQVKHSKLFIEAVHALEDTKYMASQSMLEIARDVYKLAGPDARQELMTQDYVLKGTGAMIAGEAYVSEFFGDRRGRMYQASCFGPNGQSSDVARAMMDLHGVSMDYDTKYALKLIEAEMEDMGNWGVRNEMLADTWEAVTSPAEFILRHMDDTTHIDKPWNFVKFSAIHNELVLGGKPYIGVAVGLDAKCSGPQLGALMVADQAMLAATGFSMKKLDDAYHNCIKSCEKHGITGLTRSLVKKPFMAVFYGASGGAMADKETITHKTWNAMYEGMDAEAMLEKADVFYTAINASFGRELNMVRATIKRAGIEYKDGGEQIEKFDKPLRHLMPDGFEVAMDYRVKLDIDGVVITTDKPQTTTNVHSGFIDKNFKNMLFTTNDHAYADYARTGFVNMIQASDALLARLIIVHANRLGAQHIIAIHDCFRVNIHDMAILEEAIKLAYKDLFGCAKNLPTQDLPFGTDILGLYFDGSKMATKNEYKAQCGHHSQFFKNGIRLLRAVNGVKFVDLVDSLGTTYFFSK